MTLWSCTPCPSEVLSSHTPPKESCIRSLGVWIVDYMLNFAGGAVIQRDEDVVEHGLLHGDLSQPELRLGLSEPDGRSIGPKGREL